MTDEEAFVGERYGLTQREREREREEKKKRGKREC